MESSDTRSDHLTCPACGEPNHVHAAFCGNCGRSLRDDEAQRVDPPPDDSQATGVYVPIRDPDKRDEQSLWSPDPPRDAAIDIDPGQTSAIPFEQTPQVQAPVGESETLPSASPATGPTGLRGFTLGIVSIILIAAVIALYIYSAWLSDSVRDTVDRWLPWAL